MRKLLLPFRSPWLAAGVLVLLAAGALGARLVAPTHATVAKSPATVMAPVMALASAPAPAPAARRLASTPAITAAPGSAGMRAYIDPETGKLGARPTGYVDPDAETPIYDTGEGLVEQVMPNGSIMVDLKGQFQDYAVLQIGPDGKKVIRCAQNPKLLLKDGPAAQPQPMER